MTARNWLIGRSARTRYGNGTRHLVCTLVAFHILCLTPLASSIAGMPVKTVARYTVSSRGITIGDVTTTQRMAEEAGMTSVHFETRTAVKASFLWMGYHLDTVERGTLRKGDLVSYSRKGVENGTPVDVEGRLEHACFRFEVRDQGTTRSVVIPRNAYDFTTMECPEARLDFPENRPVTLRVLDVEKMAVVKRDYQLVRNTLYPVGGKELPCRIVDFSDRNKKARRWITWDGSTVVLYRQDGKGEKSAYSVQATSVTREL